MFVRTNEQKSRRYGRDSEVYERYLCIAVNQIGKGHKNPASGRVNLQYIFNYYVSFINA